MCSLPQGWEVKKLGEVCEIKTGKSNANQAIPNGQYMFFDRSKKTKKSNRYLFDCDALIIPGEGSTFLPKHYSGKFDLHQRAYAIFNFEKYININFVENYLNFNHKYFERVAVGATVKSLRLRHFQELQIPLPPLPEQKRIVAILEKAFTAIDQAKANTEKNLKNARELFQSKLQETFANGKLKIDSGEWEEKKLGDVISITHGYAFKSQDFETNYEGVNPIVLTPGNFSEDSKLHFTQKNTKRCVSRLPIGFNFNKGDLVIVMTDLSSKMKILGKSAVIESGNILHNQRIGRVVLNKHNIETGLLYYFFQTSSYLSKIKLTATGTMVRHTAPKRILKNNIPFPKSLKEQKQIVKNLDAVSTETKKLETIYQRKITCLDELKKSILQKAFNGEL